MATIATLAVNMVARTGVFERKMKKSRRSLHALQKSAARAQQRLRNLFAAAVAVAGAGALGALVKRTLDNIDATGKLADRLSMTTKELIALRLAAQIGGVSIQMMDKSMEIMVRRLGEIRLGTGEAKAVLDKLGLSADQLVHKSPGEAFEILSKQIMKLPTAADRAVAAYYLLGRSGTKLLNTMQDLSKRGIAGITREAEKLGLTFSRLDARKVEAANDALTRVKAMLGGMWQKVVIDLAPVIESLATGFVEWGTSGEGAGQKVIGIMDEVTSAIQRTGNALENVLLFMRSDMADFQHEMAQLPNVLSWANRGKPIFGLDVDKIAETLEGRAGDAKEAVVKAMMAQRLRGSRTDRFFDSLKRQQEFLANKLQQEAGNRQTARMGIGSGAQGGLDKISSYAEKLRKQSEKFGLTQQQLRLSEIRGLEKQLSLRGSLNAVEAAAMSLALKEARLQNNKLTALEKQKATNEEDLKLTKEGLSVREKTRTVLEQYGSKAARFAKLLQAKVIDPDTYARAIRAAQMAIGGGATDIAKAYQDAGSIRNIRPSQISIRALQMDMGTTSGIERQQLTELKQINSHLRQETKKDWQ